ncbi:MAG: hypothetical protein JNM44_04250 [Chitinophagaceae bacterium]|nr:hypothetical protein [Chitinophagaceae bacterium]
MKFVQKYKLHIALTILGGVSGYLYYFYVGCASGTCAITSRPFNSTAYGAVMGWLLAGIFFPKGLKTAGK